MPTAMAPSTFAALSSIMSAFSGATPSLSSITWKISGSGLACPTSLETTMASKRSATPPRSRRLRKNGEGAFESKPILRLLRSSLMNARSSVTSSSWLSTPMSAGCTYCSLSASRSLSGKRSANHSGATSVQMTPKKSKTSASYDIALVYQVQETGPLKVAEDKCYPFGRLHHRHAQDRDTELAICAEQFFIKSRGHLGALGPRVVNRVPNQVEHERLFIGKLPH